MITAWSTRRKEGGWMRGVGGGGGVGDRVGSRRRRLYMGGLKTLEETMIKDGGHGTTPSHPALL